MADEPKDVRLPFMVTRSEAAAIDDWRYANKISSRAEAMRRLMRLGLEAASILEQDAARVDRELAEMDTRGSGFIFQEGEDAGRADGPLEQNRYTSKTARELWFKGYIKALKERLRAS